MDGGLRVTPREQYSELSYINLFKGISECKEVSTKITMKYLEERVIVTRSRGISAAAEAEVDGGKMKFS